MKKVENPQYTSDQDSEGYKESINQVTLSLHATSNPKGNLPILVDLWLDNSSLSFVSETTFKRLWPNREV